MSSYLDMKKCTFSNIIFIFYWYIYFFLIYFSTSNRWSIFRTDITCIDTRQETCYLDYRHGQCTNAIEGQFSKSLCCCSVGRAWGSERCESCPKPGTHAHQELCPRGDGFTDKQDINECIEFPGMCLNGRCKNTVGSFSCKCNQGFALDEHGIKCNGELDIYTLLKILHCWKWYYICSFVCLEFTNFQSCYRVIMYIIFVENLDYRVLKAFI